MVYVDWTVKDGHALTLNIKQLMIIIVYITYYRLPSLTNMD